MEFTDIATFATLTSVVKVLLLGRSESLPRCARILSDLKGDFLRGVGKLTRIDSTYLLLRLFPRVVDLSINMQ